MKVMLFMFRQDTRECVRGYHRNILLCHAMLVKQVLKRKEVKNKKNFCETCTICIIHKQILPQQKKLISVNRQNTNLKV